jgi:hypothetical protein
VIATIVSAFIADPVERWLFPEPRQYLTHFPTFVAAFGGAAFARQTVWTLGGFAAVAVWIPPGAEADAETIVAALHDGVSSEQHDDVFAVLEQMDAAHPTYPHWYLPWLGVDPAKQGAGLGVNSSSTVWRSSTRITCRLTSRRRIHEPSRSTSTTASK